MDWARRTLHEVAGATARQWALAASRLIGAVLGIWMLGPTAHYHRL